MPFSQGSRTRVSYLEEVTFGTTPASNFTEINVNTHTLNLGKETFQGNEIRSDRMPRYDRHGTKNAAGDIVVDMRNGEYDAFLESMMLSTWDASPSAAPDELKVGTDLKHFSIEDYAADIDQARLFTGMTVSQGQFSIQNNQTVLTTFSFVGQNMAISATEETSVSAPSSNIPFDGNTNNASLGLADAGSSATTINTIIGVDFTVDNGLGPTFVVGSDITPQLEYGMAEITGTFTAYFEDADLINRFINETETNLEITVGEPGTAVVYSFKFPRIKINGADVPLENPQSRVITIPFRALYDSTAGSNLVIERPDSS